MTSTPACWSFLRVASFSGSPPRRAGLSITRTLTPCFCAAITAASSAGSENRNILMRNDFFADAIASIIGLAESSGMTISERDIRPPILVEEWNDGVVEYWKDGAFGMAS